MEGYNIMDNRIMILYKELIKKRRKKALLNKALLNKGKGYKGKETKDNKSEPKWSDLFRNSC